jgi:hypothetical protein
MKGDLMDMLNKLNDIGDKRMNDSHIRVTKNSSLNDNDGDSKDVEVVVRKVVKQSNNDSNTTNEIFINAENDVVEEGNAVTINGKAVEDGVYEYEIEGKVTNVFVKDGKIAAIGDEAIEDLTKLVIRGGQLVKKAIKTVKKRLTGAQRAGLIKARKKAHTGAANKNRLKSFKKGQMKGLHASEDNSFNVIKVDLEKLGESLYNSVFEYLSGRYEFTEQELDNLDSALAEQVCVPVIDGNSLKVVIPVWTEDKENVDFGTFDTIELVYDLAGEWENDSLLKGLTEGDLNLNSNLIV